MTKYFSANNRATFYNSLSRRAQKIVGRLCQTAAPLIFLMLLISCATTSRHPFTEPTSEWQTRNGQLLYHGPSRTLIGEVFVRFSAAGNFELTFSKSPGMSLLTLRQDANFSEVRGALAGRGWSGPIDHAPKQLRGWLGLREKIIQAQGQHSIRYSSGAEKFLIRF